MSKSPEKTPVQKNPSQSNQKANYGTICEIREDVKKQPKRSFFSRLKQVLPFVWPRKNFLLQLVVLAAILLMVAGRAVNLFIPIYNKNIVNSLTIASTDSTLAIKIDPVLWNYVGIWLGLQALQGGMGGTSGLLTLANNQLWIFVDQYTTRQVEVQFFSHLHSLSSRWHYQRKTGMVLRALDRGSDSIKYILKSVLFTVIPAVSDILIAIVYFATSFNFIFPIIIGITSIVYLFATYYFSETRRRINRSMNDLDNKKRQLGVDGLLNSDTVKEYANEGFERDQYATLMRAYQKEEIKYYFCVNGLGLSQTVILMLGFGVAIYLFIHMVLEHAHGYTVGDYILVSTYIIQVYGPLSRCGSFYNLFVHVSVEIENMFDLLYLQPEISDSPFATPFKVNRGEVEFKNVSFGYSSDKVVLNNVSFKVPAGHAVAIVGASGAGKSTIVKLLLRLFDSNSGEILIDGRSIRSMTLNSLRSQVGVVPQDTALFNNTIRYNISYGRVNAPLIDVMGAASDACIHDRVMSLPDQYEALVGERGFKLSGGEKQRVAIARLLIKNPRIIILDEATSALDTKTERSIQSALKLLCENRTCIIVAHRLSTIIDANSILVLHEGRIVERGSHSELLAMDGSYAAMWEAQFRENEEAERPPSSSSSDELRRGLKWSMKEGHYLIFRICASAIAKPEDA